jgi:hypothetical protein
MGTGREPVVPGADDPRPRTEPLLKNSDTAAEATHADRLHGNGLICLHRYTQVPSGPRELDVHELTWPQGAARVRQRGLEPQLSACLVNLIVHQEKGSLAERARTLPLGHSNLKRARGHGLADFRQAFGGQREHDGNWLYLGNDHDAGRLGG